ncbi:uncharacterized protein LOC141839438 [Curcuma longa]|uniref:uncharacterized protein LOC141839438 n=1 Tax=Curcuma longa TaxID=136217 RepID=UPI003D9DDC58
MKASLQFRDDRSPLLRAKLPLNALGIPFLSSFTAGDPQDLRLDLSSDFRVGPMVRFSYRPNDARSPLSFALKIGAGDFGSPVAAPMSMSVEFTPLVRGGVPFFTVVFKPRLGDFSLKKTARSGFASAPSPLGRLESVAPENGFHEGKMANGFAPSEVSAISVHGVLSSTELRASSVLPLRRGASMRFRWGVKLPAGIDMGVNANHAARAQFSFRRLPQLVMSKITIEHVMGDDGSKERNRKAAAEAAETWTPVKQQLESLRADNAVLKREVRELCVQALAKREVPAASEAGTAGSRRNLERGGGKIEPKQSSPPPPAEKRTEAKSASAGNKPREDNANEELKKALMAATSGTGK